MTPANRLISPWKSVNGRVIHNLADELGTERSMHGLCMERFPNAPDRGGQTVSSIHPFSEALGAAPVRFDTTSPPLNMNSAGMPRTP